MQNTLDLSIFEGPLHSSMTSSIILGVIMKVKLPCLHAKQAQKGGRGVALPIHRILVRIL
jgi:hypothetical protein